MIMQQIYSQVKLEDGMKYYFNKLVPEYYNGVQNFYDKESEYLLKKFGIHMQGDGFSSIKDTNSISFEFYLLIEHEKQDIQVVKLAENSIENILYEYWMLRISDGGIPYDYGIFYVTKTDSLVSSREIIIRTKYYQEFFILNDEKRIDFSSINLSVLYQIKPWIELESFKKTKYEGIIIKWKKSIPYIRNQNFFEKLFFKRLKKSNRIIE